MSETIGDGYSVLRMEAQLLLRIKNGRRPDLTEQGHPGCAPSWQGE